MSKRFVVLETFAQIDILRTHLEHFIKTKPNVALVSATKEVAYQLVFLTVKELLVCRSAFKTEEDFDSQFTAVIFGKRPEEVNAEEIDVYKEFSKNPVWSGVIQELDQQLGEHVEWPTYTDWKLVDVCGLIGIAEGNDHRIDEYYRLTDQNNGEEHAVLALNCNSIISYLTNEFIKTFGVALQDQKVYNRAMITLGPTPTQHAVQRINSYFADPSQLMASMFVETLLSMYPMLTPDKTVHQVNDDLFRIIGIKHVDEFKQNYVRKVIMAFCITFFTGKIERHKHYNLEYSPNNVLAIYENKGKVTDREYKDLLNSLLNGDYLPPEQRAIAERLYQEQISRYSDAYV